MQHQESNFKAADGTTLFYQTWHPEAKPRAVMAMVHGFGDHSGRYTNIVEALSPKGIVFYGYDHRGHGKSEGKRGYISNWAEYREDLGTFLNLVRDREKGIPFFIYGHSMGGLIVLDYLIHNQTDINGAIVSTPLLAQPGISPILVMISRILSRVKPDFSLDTKLDANVISRDKNEVMRYATDPLVHSIGTARLGTELTATIDNTHKDAAKFKYPLIMVLGSDDKLVPPHGSEDFFKNISSEDKKLNVYENGFHELHNDLDKERVLGDMSAWIEEHI